MPPETEPKLIFLEGLPSTGKSTNSQIIHTAIEQNGGESQWVHELTRPHPVLFFEEAVLSAEEYERFISAFPSSRPVLERIAVRMRQSYSVDLLELEWHHAEAIGEDALTALKKFDAWHFPLPAYIEIAVEKWTHFAEQIRNNPAPVILDSALFQFQIHTFLMKDRQFEELQTFIGRLYSVIADLNPHLVYLYREDVNETIAYMDKVRGIEFSEQIWNRDKHTPYYTNRPPGAEGFREFIRDYDRWAARLASLFPYPKIEIEISEGDWPRYVADMLSFLDLQSPKVQEPAEYPIGIYRNEELAIQIEVREGKLINPSGNEIGLLPRKENTFQLEGLPVTLTAGSDKLTVTSGQLIVRWTAIGTEFAKDRMQ